MTGEEADKLYAARKVIRDSQIAWRPEGRGFVVDVMVYTERGERPKLHGHCRERYNFELLKGGKPIRRWDFWSSHRNPDGGPLVQFLKESNIEFSGTITQILWGGS